MTRKEVINSFDGTQHQLCEIIRPEKYDDFLGNFNKPIIARGAGLSYCNAATTTNGIVVNMERMNRFLEFDAGSGLITVEAGMSIGELNNFLIAHQRVFPVLPGYPSITVGGCVAFNIHGKSQFKTGTFG